MKTALENVELQCVIFKLGQEEFGLEIVQVREIVPLISITPLPSEAFLSLIGVINLRGQVIPVIDLAGQLQLRKKTIPTKTSRIVVVEVKKNRLGLLVDEVSEVLKLSFDEIEAVPEIIKKNQTSELYKGVGKQKDRLIILLDASKLELVFLEDNQDMVKGELNG